MRQHHVPVEETFRVGRPVKSSTCSLVTSTFCGQRKAIHSVKQAAEALASRFGSRHIDGRIRAFVITAMR
jgi:hypothetical protein